MALGMHYENSIGLTDILKNQKILGNPCRSIVIDIPVVLSMCHLLLNKCPDLRHVVNSPLVTCCQSPCSVFMVVLGTTE